MITVKQHGISTYRDVSVQVRVPLTRDGSNFFPDGDWDLVFTAKLNLADDDVDAVVQKSTVAGITVDGRYAILDIVPLDTTTLESNTILYCDVKGTNDVLVEQCVAATFLWRVGVSATLEDVTSIPVFTTNPPAGVDWVSNVAYNATSWNGVTDVAPSKNAVRDKFESLLDQTTLTHAGANPNVRFSITGAGSVAVNGDYVLGGTKNSAELFSTSGNDFDYPHLWREEDGTWSIGMALDVASYYTTASVANPSDGTWVTNLGEASNPPPTVAVSGTPVATHLGQWCKASTAWWQWDGTIWIPRQTLTGQQITRNDADDAYFILGVDGDGAPTTTPFP